ncbi:MAG: pyrroline-5-carboxylate reductase [Alphaproteobacteria bacterium]|nr:pyrroline-5-carboxylate reductase [Alphaproteobacteria bacterium]
MTPLVLVGGGKMGGAMLAGWLARGVAADAVVVVEPHAETAAALSAGQGVTVVANPEAVDPDFTPRTVVIAVKPQAMDEVIGGYRRFVRPETCFLSIAAGKEIGYFHDRLGADAVVARAMPNTPAAVGRGMSVVCADAKATEAQRADCQELLEAVGQVAWIEDEELLHAVTAVSGGGPAYVFLLVESLAAAGVAAGLPAELSMRIARATVAGSGALLDGSEESAAQLRINVTSPKGTTEQALAVLMAEDGMAPLFVEAIAAATRRSRALAG